MSYDFDTRLKPCDHLQLKERMVIYTPTLAQTLHVPVPDDTWKNDGDFRTLVYAARPYERMRGPISAKNTVRLFMSGVEIPSDHGTYGWQILDDERSVRPDKKSKIVFKKPVRMTNLLIEVQYLTIPAYCLKCNGYSKTNDYSRNKSGVFMHVNDYDKLVQRVYKFLLTSSCKFYPAFTSRLKEFVGRKFGGTLSEEDISYECMTALDNLKRIQIAQRSIQFLTPQEVLKNVESITTVRDQYDPTIVRTRMLVSAFGVPKSVPLTFTIRTNKG